MYKRDEERALKALESAKKAQRKTSLDRRLNDISYHTNKLRQAIEALNDNIDDLRYEINSETYE